MVRRVALTLRDPPKELPKAEKTHFTMRLTPEYRAYLERAMKKTGSEDMKSVVIAAIDLDRGLDEELSDLRDELRAVAKAEGLDLSKGVDLAKVLAPLVRAGLAKKKR